MTIAGMAPATALDNGGADATSCSCLCDLGANGGAIVPNLIYNAGGFGCAALEGRTCNVEDPRQPGLIRSGRVQLCQPMIELSQTVATPVHPLDGTELFEGVLQPQ
ncbi:MAG: hypothetical protein R3F55_24420 [Alphaproteobacteria bacterium]